MNGPRPVDAVYEEIMISARKWQMRFSFGALMISDVAVVIDGDKLYELMK